VALNGDVAPPSAAASDAGTTPPDAIGQDDEPTIAEATHAVAATAARQHRSGPSTALAELWAATERTLPELPDDEADNRPLRMRAVEKAAAEFDRDVVLEAKAGAVVLLKEALDAHEREQTDESAARLEEAEDVSRVIGSALPLDEHRDALPILKQKANALQQQGVVQPKRTAPQQSSAPETVDAELDAILEKIDAGAELTADEREYLRNAIALVGVLRQKAAERCEREPTAENRARLDRAERMLEVVCSYLVDAVPLEEMQETVPAIVQTAERMQIGWRHMQKNPPAPSPPPAGPRVPTASRTPRPRARAHKSNSRSPPRRTGADDDEDHDQLARLRRRRGWA
jgi:ribosome assembly protein YihI (activator of Der GTPase)